jgi:hypothetical protein
MIQPEQVGRLFAGEVGRKLLGVELQGGAGSLAQDWKIVLSFGADAGLSFVVLQFRKEGDRWSCTGFDHR